MIQTNGYYLDNPKFYEDYVGGNKSSGFSHFAFCFFENGSFLTGSKHEDSSLTEFIKDDFDHQRNHKYFIHGSTITLIFDYDKEWSDEYTMKIYNVNTLCNKDSIMTFHKWK